MASLTEVCSLQLFVAPAGNPAAEGLAVGVALGVALVDAVGSGVGLADDSSLAGVTSTVALGAVAVGELLTTALGLGDLAMPSKPPKR